MEDEKQRNGRQSGEGSLEETGCPLGGHCDPRPGDSLCMVVGTKLLSSHQLRAVTDPVLNSWHRGNLPAGREGHSRPDSS